MRATLIALVLIVLPAMAVPEPHAVLTPDLTLITHFEDHDPGLVVSYRQDPTKAKKVELLRYLIVPTPPVPSLQQVVEPAGTNLNDGGYAIGPNAVTKAWVLRNLTTEEIAVRNAQTASEVSSDLSTVMTTDHWEQGFLRLNKLQSEALYFLFTLVTRGGFHTNLTVPERTRANTVSNELMDIYKLWQVGRTNYYFTLTNPVVVLPPTNYPPITVEE